MKYETRPCRRAPRAFSILFIINIMYKSKYYLKKKAMLLTQDLLELRYYEYTIWRSRVESVSLPSWDLCILRKYWSVFINFFFDTMKIPNFFLCNKSQSFRTIWTFYVSRNYSLTGSKSTKKRLFGFSDKNRHFV